MVSFAIVGIFLDIVIFFSLMVFPFRRNFGRGRYLPFAGNEVKVHVSVKSRMQKNDPPYSPAAYNWKEVNMLNMIKWVT